VAISAEPRLVHPTHYTGQPNYVTDTENTDVYTKYAEHQVEQIYQTVAQGEKSYAAEIQAKTEKYIRDTCESYGDCDEIEGGVGSEGGDDGV
jgi:hypothetical protein